MRLTAPISIGAVGAWFPARLKSFRRGFQVGPPRIDKGFRHLKPFFFFRICKQFLILQIKKATSNV